MNSARHYFHHPYFKQPVVKRPRAHPLKPLTLNVVGDSMAASEDDVDDQYYPPPPTHHRFYTLSYPDHTYVRPIPLTPTNPTVLAVGNPLPITNGHIEVDDVSANTTISTSNDGSPSKDTVAEECGVTRCICDFTHDDGYMICCDRCSVWQHVDCMQISKDNIPEIYYCERCQPRKLNKHRAVQLQTRTRAYLNIDTSETESENETKLASTKKITTKKAKLIKKDAGNKFSGLSRKLKKNALKNAPNGQDKGRGKIRQYKKKALRPLQAVPTPQVQSPWKSTIQFADTYEEAEENLYSAEIREHLNRIKKSSQGQNGRPHMEHRKQLCRVATFGTNNKMLESTEDLSPNEPLIEFKGKIISKQQFLDEVHHANPRHILIYNNVESMDVCINARTYGNDARHVRRSCTPNAEVRHFIEGGKLYFHLYSTQSVRAGNEITIPFDMIHEVGSIRKECACGNEATCKWRSLPTSPLTTSNLKVPTKAARKQTHMMYERETPADSGEDIVSPVTPELPPMSPPPTAAPPPPPPPQARRRRISSATSTESKKEKNAPTTPVKKEKPVGTNDGHKHKQPSSPKKLQTQESRESQHEEVAGDHKLSREERKMQAIMKAFERLEQQQERKKDGNSRDSIKETCKKGKDKTMKRKKSKDSKDEDSKLDSPTSEQEYKPSQVVKKKKKKGGKVCPGSRGTSLDDTDNESKDKAADKEPVEQTTSSPVIQPTPEDTVVKPATKSKKKTKKKGVPAKRQTHTSSTASSSGNSDAPEDSTSESVTSGNDHQVQPSASPAQTDQKEFKSPLHKAKRSMMSDRSVDKKETEPITLSTPSVMPTGDSSPSHFEIASPSSEQLEVSMCIGNLTDSDFVQCLPSPQAGSIDISREKRPRGKSTSGCAVNSLQNSVFDAIKALQKKNVGPTPVSTSAPPKTPTVKTPTTPQPELGSGNTKKRWLLQAMNDSDQSENNTTPSPTSKGFATPLKKRRQARESMGSDTVTPTSSVPNTPLAPITNPMFPSDLQILGTQIDFNEVTSKKDEGASGIPDSSIPFLNDKHFHQVEEYKVIRKKNEVHEKVESSWKNSFLPDSTANQQNNSIRNADECMNFSSDAANTSSSTEEEAEHKPSSTCVKIEMQETSSTCSPVCAPSESKAMDVKVDIKVKKEAVSSPEVSHKPLEKEDGEISEEEELPSESCAVPDQVVDSVSCTMPEQIQPDSCYDVEQSLKEQHERLKRLYDLHSNSSDQVSSTKVTAKERTSCEILTETSETISTGGLSPAEVGSMMEDVSDLRFKKQISSPGVTCSESAHDDVYNRQNSEASESKKKVRVSLGEYRKRKGTLPKAPLPEIGFLTMKSSPAKAPTYPTFPLAAPVRAKKNDGEAKDSTQKTQEIDQKQSHKKKELEWNSDATMAERIREQTHMSLTERLKSEFGLDTLPEDDVNGITDEREQSPPPPPPPPRHLPLVRNGTSSTVEDNSFLPGNSTNVFSVSEHVRPLSPPPLPPMAATVAAGLALNINQHLNDAAPLKVAYNHIPSELLLPSSTLSSFGSGKKPLLQTPALHKSPLLSPPAKSGLEGSSQSQGLLVPVHDLNSSSIALPLPIPPPGAIARSINTIDIGAAKIDSALMPSGIPPLMDMSKITSFSYENTLLQPQGERR